MGHGGRGFKVKVKVTFKNNELIRKVLVNRLWLCWFLYYPFGFFCIAFTNNLQCLLSNELMTELPRKVLAFCQELFCIQCLAQGHTGIWRSQEVKVPDLQ